MTLLFCSLAENENVKHVHQVCTLLLNYSVVAFVVIIIGQCQGRPCDGRARRPGRNAKADLRISAMRSQVSSTSAGCYIMLACFKKVCANQLMLSFSAACRTTVRAA